MENMEFYSLVDFYPKKEAIKKCYDLLSIEEIKNYKRFVYSLPWMDDDTKDLIWEYFNDWSLEIWSKLAIKYRAHIEKNERVLKKYEEEDKRKNENKYNVKVK